MSDSPPSALILDRDGTINAMALNPRGEQDSPYFPKQLELYPRLQDLLAPFAAARVPLFVATNQPGIAKGWFSRADLAAMNAALVERLQYPGFDVDSIFACIHHPVGVEGSGDRTLVRDCECRKPKPGLLHSIRDEFGIDLSRAIYVGDSQVDMEAGRAAKVGEVFLVRTLISDTVPPALRRVQVPDGPPLSAVLQKIVSGWKQQ